MNNVNDRPIYPKETIIKAPKLNRKFGRMIIDSRTDGTVTNKNEMIHNYRWFSEIQRDEKCLEGPSEERVEVEEERIFKSRFGDYFKLISVS